MLQVKKDAIFVLLKNGGSLVVDKLKKLGQANVPEGQDPLTVFYRMERLPSQTPEERDDEVDEEMRNAAAEEERKRQQEAKMSLLFGNLGKKSK